MATIEQIRAARALLGWSQKELADQAGLSQTGIARLENGTHQPNTATLEKIIAAFNQADVEFIDESGLRKRSGDVKILKGKEGFKTFMDDVYETAKEYGGDICIFNSKPGIWYEQLGKEWYGMHSKRMKALGDRIKVRITVQEKDTFFVLDSAEHRWFPKDMWNDKIFYAYGPKLGFLNFVENNIQIMVLHQSEFAESFRVLFDIAWEHVATPVPQNQKNNEGDVR